MTTTELKKQFGEMATRTALTVMVKRGFAGKYFSVYGKQYTPTEALKKWPPVILDRACHHGRIKFFGGPPRSGHWYTGTVLSMLCDIFLFDWATKGLPIEEKLAI